MNKRSLSPLLFSMAIYLLISSCSGTDNTGEKDKEVIYNGGGQVQTKDRESLIDRNKKMILLEQEKIDSFLLKNQLIMDETKTGIHYKIEVTGNGEKPKTLDEVSLKYKLNLLDGTYCYSSDSSGVLQLKIGQSDEPTGLQEVLQEIPRGSKAKIIIPSYLAYGLSGDGDKIGGGESLVYTIELLKDKK
ncbi:MAG: FKBP-type peptidyl-prolyl cis-trans isomerase [Bacteroidota bacterium]